MVGTASNAGLRRKARIARDEQEARAMSPARALRLAMEKTANEAFSLMMQVTALTRSRTDHAGLLTMIPDGLLLLLLDGPDGAIGVITLDPATLAALIEMQTVGQVLDRAPRDRPLTRTDAAMVAPLVDGILHRMTLDLSTHPDRFWTCGYRFGAMIEDRRSLRLAMNAPDYHVFRLDLDIAGGLRQGAVTLALPCLPDPAQQQHDADQTAAARQLHARVLDAPVRLDAVLCRLSLPLSGIGKLAVGTLLPLPADALRDITVEAVGRRRVASGQLGKLEGVRAIRLNLPATDPFAPPAPDGIPPAEVGADVGPMTEEEGFQPIIPGQPGPMTAPLDDLDLSTSGSLAFDDPLDLPPLDLPSLDSLSMVDDLDPLARFGLVPGPEAA